MLSKFLLLSAGWISLCPFVFCKIDDATLWKFAEIKPFFVCVLFSVYLNRKPGLSQIRKKMS